MMRPARPSMLPVVEGAREADGAATDLLALLDADGGGGGGGGGAARRHTLMRHTHGLSSAPLN